jgi:predicted transposase/invertase (TIGR01784 family)
VVSSVALTFVSLIGCFCLRHREWVVFMAEHDSSYKLLFSYPEMVEDLLKGFVHEEWVQHLDFSTLEKVSGSYVSDDLRDREDDVIWRVRWGTGWLYVYLLLEFQSTVDTFMAVRIMTYVGLLYQELIRRKELTPSGKLPPVFPAVLYNGSGRWTAALGVQELVEPVPGGLEAYVPRLRYTILDEDSYSEADLKPLRNLSAALFRLENSRDPENMRQVVATLVEWLKEPRQKGLQRAFTVWLKRVLLPARMPGVEIPELQDLQEVESMLAERVKEWTEQWKQEGLEQGLEQGRAEGRAEGGAALLVLQLELKFGRLLGEHRARVEAADTETLLKWGERLLRVERLEDVFGD